MLGMATYLGDGKLWIQTSGRPGEGWALQNYLYPTHYNSCEPLIKFGYGICLSFFIRL